MSRLTFFVFIFACLAAGPLAAQMRLPQIIGHNMVLQQKKPLPVWGYASPGDKVTVSFNGQSKSTLTQPDGRWQVVLDPLPASATPRTLTITGRSTIELKNILVGEVWLCSGQSNMEYTMRKNSKVDLPQQMSPNPVAELDHASNDNIRLFLVDRKQLSRPDTLHTRWSVARDSALRSFSAAAYFFAKELNRQLRVPVGVISAAVPGSAIEPWLPGTILNEKELAENHPPVRLNVREPGKFFPEMIEPLAPLAIKGFLWYQGETNCFQGESLAYTYKMQALVEGWRGQWRDNKLPFYYVQIAPFYYSHSAGKYPLTKETLPRFWEAQQLALQLPHTGMITTTDLIDTATQLHPPYKWEVGRRLALLALAKTYGKKIAYSGPVFQQARVVGNKLALRFIHAESGLKSIDGKPLTGFELAGTDGKFYPAQAMISDREVIVSGSDVPQPVSVRFAWDETGRANLFNNDGQPAVPFRTDRQLRLINIPVVLVKGEKP